MASQFVFPLPDTGSPSLDEHALQCDRNRICILSSVTDGMLSVWKFPVDVVMLSLMLFFFKKKKRFHDQVRQEMGGGTANDGGPVQLPVLASFTTLSSQKKKKTAQFHFAGHITRRSESDIVHRAPKRRHFAWWRAPQTKLNTNLGPRPHASCSNAQQRREGPLASFGGLVAETQAGFFCRLDGSRSRWSGLEGIRGSFFFELSCFLPLHLCRVDTVMQ